MKRVSVIVPVYNTEEYLKKCLDSLVNQTLEDIEIIIANDGSTDGSSEIIDEYLLKYPNKIKTLSKNNGGQASARNLGILNSSGEFLTFVDSDDYIEKDMLKKLYNRAMSDNSDIVFCDMAMYGDKEGIIKCFRQIGTDNKKNYVISEPGPTCKLIKSEIIKKNNLLFLENHIYEDIAIVPLWGVFAGNISYLDEPLYHYLVHTDSTMNKSKYDEKMKDIFISMDNLYNEFLNRDLLEKYREEMEFIYIKDLLHAASLRFLEHKEAEDSLNKIIRIMHEKFPNWRKNKYYKLESLKYKLMCNLIDMKQFWLLKIRRKK